MWFSWTCIFREGVGGSEGRELHVLSKLYLHTHYACTQHTLVQRWLNMFCVGSLLLCFLEAGIANGFVLHAKSNRCAVAVWSAMLRRIQRLYLRCYIYVQSTIFCLIWPMHNAGLLHFKTWVGQGGGRETSHRAQYRVHPGVVQASCPECETRIWGRFRKSIVTS